MFIIHCKIAFIQSILLINLDYTRRKEQEEEKEEQEQEGEEKDK